MRNLKTILSIAGSDSIGGAGIQADVRAANACGVHCLTAVTSVTAQNSKGIKAIYPLSPEMIKSQIESVLEDVMPDAIKIGLIGSVAASEAIADCLDSINEKIPMVVDPILSASAGGYADKEFEKSSLINFYQTLFLERLIIPTPNFHEAQMLLHTKSSSLSECAVGLLNKFELEAIIVTGGDGHTITPVEAIYGNDSLADILVCLGKEKIFKETTNLTDKKIVEKIIVNKRISTHNLHGTGCLFSTILACNLAKGANITEAFVSTSQFQHKIIENSRNYVLGGSSYGPLNINGYSF